MKKVILLILGLFIVISCGYDNPGSITDVILTDYVKNDIDVSLRQVMIYNNKSFSYATYDSFLGYDVYISNSSSNTLTDVTVSIVSTNPAGYDFNGVDFQSPLLVGNLFSGWEAKPDFYWFISATSTKIGNFYFQTPEQGIGYTTLEVNYKVSYIHELDGYKEVYLTQIISLN
jgi:hypothetical protein